MDYYFESNADSAKTFTSKRTPAFKEIFEWLDAIVISVIASYIAGIQVGKNWDKFTEE